MRDRWRNDEGIALITVLMMIMMISVVSTLLLTDALRQRQQSEFLEREDVVLAGTEALLERYAAKVTLDPLYFLHMVDEAERTRLCTDTGSIGFGLTVDPGNTWYDDCTTWDYQDTPDNDLDGKPDWWTHPLLEGDPSTANDDVSALLEVDPPSSGVPLTVSVAGRRGDTVNRRLISASIDATSLSEFFRVTENDLNYGAGADIYGKIYSGNDLNFYCSSPCTDLGIVHNHTYAENEIKTEPVKAEAWVEFYDDIGEHNPIRDVFADPLNFSNFWDDLGILASVACDVGGTLCLDTAGADAWMVHPYMSGTTPRVRVWYTTTTNTQSCVTTEEYFWLYPEDPSIIWTYWGDVEIPDNGALWANNHIVVGSLTWAGGSDFDGQGQNDSVVGRSLTMYAGTAGSKANVVVNTDIYYDNPASYATVALIASDEIVLNPNSVGTDRELHVNSSLLGQDNKWRVARACGDSGSVQTPSNSVLYMTGSIATKSTGDIGAHFPTRYYGFDDRLEYLRPPFFPLLDGEWTYEDWREQSLPAWADA